MEDGRPELEEFLETSIYTLELIVCTFSSPLFSSLLIIIFFKISDPISIASLSGLSFTMHAFTFCLI